MQASPETISFIQDNKYLSYLTGERKIFGITELQISDALKAKGTTTCGHCQGLTTREIANKLGYIIPFKRKYEKLDADLKSGLINPQQFAELEIEIDAAVIYYTNPDKKANLGLTFGKTVVAAVGGFVTGGPAGAVIAAVGTASAASALEKKKATEGIANLKNEIAASKQTVTLEQDWTDVPAADSSLDLSNLSDDDKKKALIAIVIIVILLGIIII